MDKLKQYVTFAVLGAVVILAAGWFLLVSPKKTEATDLQAQTASQVSANAVLATQLQVLQAQAKELPKKQAELARVSALIPDNPSLPTLIRAITTASASAGVEFVSITPAAPALVAAPVAAAPVAAPPAEGEDAAAAAAPVDPAAAAAAAAGPVGQLAQIPIVLNVVGGYFEVQQFLSNLEDLPRALRVTNLTVAPGASPTAGESASGVENGSSLTSTITGSVFMAAGSLPVTPVVAPVAAPAN